MKVTEALELEMKAILTKDKGHPAYQRDDVAQVLIGIRFKDGNTHWILPCKNTTEKMSLDLSKICIESDRWESISMVKDPLAKEHAHSSSPRNKNFLQRIMTSFCPYRRYAEGK